MAAGWGKSSMPLLCWTRCAPAPPAPCCVHQHCFAGAAGRPDGPGRTPAAAPRVTVYDAAPAPSRCTIDAARSERYGPARSRAQDQRIAAHAIPPLKCRKRGEVPSHPVRRWLLWRDGRCASAPRRDGPQIPLRRWVTERGTSAEASARSGPVTAAPACIQLPSTPHGTALTGSATASQR
jgi:hypothetical protein